MRIQHNIPAMSAYRYYTNNNSALAKNLEKLSSGYKINRAGDDAAGLAISEKMRAQITGLEVAQKNAKDGISLVQTAEGALTEVHDMLNRMVTLAEQSANGTYDNDVDRAQLQKELDQLRSEIDRIADSSNFNGIKLLDGSLDDGIADSDTLKLGNLSTVTTGMILPGVDKTSAKSGTSSTGATSGTSATSAASTETKAPVKTEFALNLEDLDITLKPSDLDKNYVRIEINFGRKTSATSTQKDIRYYYDFAKADVEAALDSDGKLSASKLSKLLAEKSDLKPTNDTTTYDADGYWMGRVDIAGVAMNGATDGGYSGFDVKVDTENNQLLFKLHDIDMATEEELNLDWNSIGSTISCKVSTVSAQNTGAAADALLASDSVQIDESSRVNGWRDGMQDPTGIIGTNTIVYNDVGDPKKTEFFVNLEDLKWQTTAAQLNAAKDSAGNDIEWYMLKVDFGTMSPAPGINGGTVEEPRRAMAWIPVSKNDVIASLSTDENGNSYVDMEKLLPKLQDELTKDSAGDDADGFHMQRVDVAGVSAYDKYPTDGGFSGFDFKTEGTGLHFRLHDTSMAHPDEANANWGNVTVSIMGSSNTTTDSTTLGRSDFTDLIVGGDSAHGWSVGTIEMQTGVLPGQNTFANTVLDIGKTGFDVDNAANNDGYTITADGKTFVLAVGDEGVAKADLGDTGAIVVKVNKSASVDKQLEELANAMNKACKTWEVGATAKHASAGYGLSFRQREDGAKATDNAGHDLTTVEGVAKAFSFGKSAVKSVMAGKKLTLQIGDTAEEFNKLNVSVKDMHTDAMGIGDIDISTQDGAAAAMNAIKDAINYVSDVRGSLGATQNRLDHTINNLSVMQENIQDAESTIRDTDIAEEMMEYTKNNILVQAAQAMLAQANQLPQGVLQLLG